MSNLPLPFDGDSSPAEVSAEAQHVEAEARDRAGRERAVDPRFNVALEASAGTGKTRVLVDRYVNLLRAGVDPSNILAITFTRKAASEMRDRIMATLRIAAARGEISPARWRELRDRTAEVTISTIDAFCLSLLREFPLEADLDPGFSIADETEVPRLVDASLDGSLRICRAAAREDEEVALVFAQLGERRARRGLAALLNRRIVAPQVLTKYLAAGPVDLDVAGASRRGASALLVALESMRGGLDRFLDSGPLEPPFEVLKRDLRQLRDAVVGNRPLDPAAVQATFMRTREHFLTLEGEPRTKSPYGMAKFANRADWEMHRDLVVEHAGNVRRVLTEYRRDLNVLVSRGIWRMFRIAEAEYRRTLDAHAVLDFSDLLLRALGLLRQMEEFSQSRYRLESRYHHVLVDEFQDTSRAQWELVSLLIQSWGEGMGLPHAAGLQPSVFIVGDPKQSIYGFRDADVSVLKEAARRLDALRGDGSVRRSISRSFRAVPSLLSFVNDVCRDIGKTPQRRDAFRYSEEDQFPVNTSSSAVGATHASPLPAIGIVAGDTPEACAEHAAAEIAQLLAIGTTVRDRETGVPRPVRPADIAILFRTRESHREFEDALARHGVQTYVYKGLGFFDADEVKDVLALLWYLADPLSDLRAAAFLRSRFVHLPDEALRRLAPELANALRSTQPPAVLETLEPDAARALRDAREATLRWRALVDRIPPAELLDVVLNESAYAFELRGPRFHQARENLKKIRGLVRRMQNRGYATLGRIAAHLDRLSVGDESNAVIDALDAVSLMTVHAAKGLEFPIVFLVNLARGTGNRRDPIRIAVDGSGESVSVAVGDFQSDADEDERSRDIEETKRLLYVALTRARDRLYLGSVLKEGRMQPGRGSLAEVMPVSLLEQFAASDAADGSVEWRASSGAVHQLRTNVGRGFTPRQAGREGPPHEENSASDFMPLADGAAQRISIADIIGPGIGRASVDQGRESDRLVGTLVHRLLQRFGFEGRADGVVPAELLRPGEMPGDAASLDEAMAAYRAICQRPDVSELYRCGERFHEVPFTTRKDGTLLRGTIDCLIRTAPDRITVLEFKTGRPRDEHRLQLELYREAAERLFPGSAIDPRLIYANEAQVS